MRYQDLPEIEDKAHTIERYEAFISTFREAADTIGPHADPLMSELIEAFESYRLTLFNSGRQGMDESVRTIRNVMDKAVEMVNEFFD